MTVLESPGEAVAPTVADVLALPALRYGRPEVLAASNSLDRRVRWVHVSELPDIAGLLRGGEIILTTGIAMPADNDGLREYANSLARAGAVALVVELGRRFTELPRQLISACERRGLPLVALHRVVRFVKVTEAVHSLIFTGQLAALRTSEQAHEVFTRLGVEGASIGEIVSAVAGMAGSPVVFENVAHQVVAFDTAGTGTDDLLREWEGRARAAHGTARTQVCGPEGWLVTAVQARGQVWGRLVMLTADAPKPSQVMLLERAATALTLNRLTERSQETLERAAHRSTLTDIIGRRYPSEAEMHARTAALGVPTARRTLLALVVDVAGPGAHETLTDLVAGGAHLARVPAIVAALPEDRVGALLAFAPSVDRSVPLGRLTEHVHAQLARRQDRAVAVIGVGSAVIELAEVGRSFAEATQVAEAARGSVERKPYYELPDIQLRGLLYMLRDDARLQAFVERTLGALLEHDRRTGGDLLTVLGAYLDHADNKSAAAQAAHLSRPALYERLATIERVTGVSLAVGESRASLHAALIALAAIRSRG